MKKSKIEIYTDGACSQNGNWSGGWGFCVYEDGNLIYEDLGGEANTTNNRMEMKAYINALGYAITNKTNEEIIIYSDSAYLINCFNQKWIDNWQKNGWRTSNKTEVLNKDLWIEILKLREQCSHSLIKVKGHSDVEGNIKADLLATRARKEIK